MLWSSKEIAEATGGSESGPFAVDGVAFDSREVEPGDLFIALSGAQTDGHHYLDQAFAHKAAGAIVTGACTHPHVRVADSFAAMQDLARAARARSTARIVGITGSVGKTSAKEALFAAIERAMPGKVHRSVKSYNNHTGVPLSLARMPRDAAAGVFEMGMNHAGELASLTRLVRPHVAMVTAIAPAHIEYFASIEAIADAKGEVFQGLEPGGTAVVPFDSPFRDRLIAAAKPFAARIVTFGRGEGADVRAIEAVRLETGASFVTARIGKREVSFTLSQPGAHWVSNALGVLACVDAVDGDLGLAGLALAELGGLAGRGERFMAQIEGGAALIIDESYNANPASVAAALSVLAEERGRHVAVLGEMRELGDRSAGLHADLAEPVRRAAVEQLVLVGEAITPLARALEGKVDFVHVADATAALAEIEKIVTPGDAVLIKGSNGVALSRVVAELKAGRA